MAHDREVAGIRCHAVLEGLSSYLDDELDADTRARVEAHLKGCDWCERFGREMSGVVAGLRKQLAENQAVDEGVASRLMERLALE